MRSIKDISIKANNQFPEKILQFGEGNFLRGFADWMIDLANTAGLFQGSIVLCQPIDKGLAEAINQQNGLYTLLMRGKENGQAREETARISSVSRCINPYADYEALLSLAHSAHLQVIISNTTEAGIAWQDGVALNDSPPASYPGKLTAFLYERFKTFGGTPDSGLLILPVELIDNNGSTLRAVVRRYVQEWQLPVAFQQWLDAHVCFANTLVDRIVTGYPREEIEEIEQNLGYKDTLLVTSELFNLWVIEAEAKWAEVLPIAKTAANVIWTDNAAPYKKRKVRILNGGHTSMVLAAWLAGHDTVLDCMQDTVFRDFLRRLLFEEVIPTLDLPKEELEAFAKSVIDRFDNPFIRHRLLDISLNSCSKFAARCLPSLLAYQEDTTTLPPRLTFSFAAFMAFYRGKMKDGKYMGQRSGTANATECEIRDDAAVLAFFDSVWNAPNASPSSVARAVLSNASLWNGKNLSEVPGLTEAVAENLHRIITASNLRDVVASLA